MNGGCIGALLAHATLASSVQRLAMSFDPDEVAFSTDIELWL